MPVHSAEVLVTLQQLLMVVTLILHDSNARPLTRSNRLPVGYHHQHSLLSTTAATVHHHAATPKTETIQQMNKEEETMNSGRRRRSAEVPYQGMVAIPRSMKNRIDQYFDWRRINGYGRMSRRWGK